MNPKGKNLNLIIAGVVVIIIGVAGYLYASRDRSGDILLTSTSSATVAAVDGDLLSALRQVRQLKLDSSLFATPIWLSLVDFSKTISTQPQNRQNPFAPLDSSLVATPSSTSTP